MMSTNRQFSLGRLPVVAAIVAMISGCTVQEVNSPSHVGVSELGIGMSITAEPEFLPRDGSSTSRITLKAFDADGKPIVNQRFHLEASAGSLGVSDIATGSDGTVQLMFVAPGINVNVDVVRISATPYTNQNLQNANPRYVDILVSGPDIPVASFNFTPPNPAQYQLVTLDATTSALSFRQCLDVCSYLWTFPDGSTDNRRVVQKRFENIGPNTVRLLVTSPAGTSSTVSRTINVGNPVPPTVTLVFSPLNPTNGSTVNFIATAQPANGATIRTYRWNFGGGTGVPETPTGENTATFLAVTSTTYLVTVTVEDSNGSTTSAQTSVTVQP